MDDVKRVSARWTGEGAEIEIVLRGEGQEDDIRLIDVFADGGNVYDYYYRGASPGKEATVFGPSAWAPPSRRAVEEFRRAKARRLATPEAAVRRLLNVTGPWGR